MSTKIRIGDAEFVYPECQKKFDYSLGSVKMIGINKIISNSNKVVFSQTINRPCPSCNGQLDFFMNNQCHCWDCGNVYNHNENGLSQVTPLLTDNELDRLLEDNKIDSKPKPKCPDCNSVFIKQGIRLFTSVEPNKCGNCGYEWDPK